MEELICIESKAEMSGWFIKGNEYSLKIYYDGRLYVLDEEGDAWDLEQSHGGAFTVNFLGTPAVTFTTASNHDASADDSEGGCRE